MPVIVEGEGLSGKSIIFSMGATILGIASLILFLPMSKGADVLTQLCMVVITLGLFLLGGLAWTGALDKPDPKMLPPKKPEGFKPEPLPVTEKVKPVPKENWADKWLKDNNK